MAETGPCKPATQTTKKITKEGIPVSIFDTKGFETKEYKETLAELEKFVSDKRNESDVNNKYMLHGCALQRILDELKIQRLNW